MATLSWPLAQAQITGGLTTTQIVLHISMKTQMEQPKVAAAGGGLVLAGGAGLLLWLFLRSRNGDGDGGGVGGGGFLSGLQATIRAGVANGATKSYGVEIPCRSQPPEWLGIISCPP